MARQVLQGLSRDELIELVMRLSEVAVAGQQQGQIGELKRRVAELEAGGGPHVRLLVTRMMPVTSARLVPVGMAIGRSGCTRGGW